MTPSSPATGRSFWTAFGARLSTEASRLAETRGWARYGIAFGLGALTATAMAPFYFLFALVIGYCALTLLLDGASEAATPKRMAFLTGWAFGFGYFLFGMYWLGFAFLVQADQFGWMIPIAIPAFTGFLGLFYALPAWLAMFRWRKGYPRLFLLAALIAGFEYLRGHILTGLPWNLTAQAFAGSALLAQPLAWLGPYGYSLVLLLLALLPVLAIRVEGPLDWRPLAGLGAGVLGILLFGGLRLAMAPPLIDPDRPDAPRVTVVQPNVSQRDKFEMTEAERVATLERMLAMSRMGHHDGVPVIAVWPENAHPYLANYTDSATYLAEKLPPRMSLVSGTFRYWDTSGEAGPTRHYGNAVAVFGETMHTEGAPGEKPLLHVYDKHHLVPFGEYLPMRGLLKALGLSQLAPVEEGFTPGPGPQTLDVAGLKISPLICYEDVFPGELYPAGQRPDLLVVVTNDAWFGDDAGPRQHLDISRMRTIESGLPMARSANTGISGIFSAHGRLIAEVPLYQDGTISITIPPKLAKTLYAQLAQLIFALVFIASLLVGLGSRVARTC